MNYTVVVLGGVLILSLIWYYFPIYGGVHWFTGPVRNVGNDDTAVHVSGDSASVDGKAAMVVEKRVEVGAR